MIIYKILSRQRPTMALVSLYKSFLKFYIIASLPFFISFLLVEKFSYILKPKMCFQLCYQDFALLFQ